MSIDILVVDDEEDIRELVSGILEDEGFSPRTAAEATSALAAVRDRLPSCGDPRCLAAKLLHGRD